MGSASSAVDDVRRAATDATARTVSRVGAAADDWTRPVQHAMEDPEARDKLLLGAAGVAVIAALGIAYQRRLSETAEAE